ncbi:hypothetical protein ABZ820_10855 [Streptomyces diacarni]|uniref:hypothetical protein n=1 Tax=Streptomyces diacarni TaxID=2800381 RepID=UPI0033D64B6B
MLRIRINEAGQLVGSGPCLDARARVTGYVEPGPGEGDGTVPLPPLMLAEFHPDALPAATAGSPAPLSEPLPDPRAAWPSFFHRVHRILPPEGILLVASRQRRDDGRLTDPLGELTASARTAGFSYLQHLVIAHLHPDSDQHPALTSASAASGLIHSDVLLFSPHF